MLVAAAVVPTPPLLVPEIAGGSAVRDAELRAACDAAVTALVAVGAERLILVGAAPETGPVEGGWDWRRYGVPLPDPAPAGSLPPALAIGAWLLSRAGASADLVVGVSADEPASSCVALGQALVGDVPTALLVAGDGSARRDEKAPGFLDPRAAAFDEAWLAALEAGDPQPLLAMDRTLAADLLAAGAPAWQVLAGAAAAADHRWSGRVTWAGAPYGVGYVVASWRPAP